MATASATTSVAGHRLDPSTIPLLVTLGLGVFAGALDLGVLSPALAGARDRLRRRRARAAVGLHALFARERREHPDHDEARRPQRTPADLHRVRRDLRRRFADRDRVGELSDVPDRARDPGVRRGRHLPGRDGRDRRPHPTRAARRRARARRRDVGRRRDRRPAVRRHRHALLVLALDLRRQRAAGDRRDRDGAHDACR